LFADLAYALDGRPERVRPGLARVAATMREHAALLVDWLGSNRGVIEFRKHVAWYFKGFAIGSELRQALVGSSTLAELEDQYEHVEKRFDDACWVGSRLAELLPLQLLDKQVLLEMSDPVARLDALMRVSVVSES
jgi:Lon protease-like protein